MFRKIFLLFLCSTFLLSCKVEMEPIRYGFDSCENCKMLIMDPKFGAVVLTTKGKNFKFDDTNCLVSYINTNFKNNTDIASIAVVDFGEQEKLIAADSAFYVQSPSIKSPMAGGIAAFSDSEKGNHFIQQWKGTSMTWKEVKANFE